MQKRKLRKVEISDIINALTHYDIRHVEFPMEYLLDDSEIYGIADDYKKVLYINKEKSEEDKREAVLHELCHAVHYLRGDLMGMGEEEKEHITDKDAKKLLRDIYEI